MNPITNSWNIFRFHSLKLYHSHSLTVIVTVAISSLALLACLYSRFFQAKKILPNKHFRDRNIKSQPQPQFHEIVKIKPNRLLKKVSPLAIPVEPQGATSEPAKTGGQ